jgi:creatinine amidohydrolase
MTEVMMQYVSWVEYAQRMREEQPVIFIPVGALEQHGPHLPLGVDALLATAVARTVAQRVGGLVTAPINYGYKSQARCGGGQCFPGTTSLDAASLTGIICDLSRELVRHGARRLVVVNGHYENQWFLIEGVELALRELRRDAADLRVMRLEYWDFCSEETLAPMFPGGFPGFALEHAALIETSLMLHVHPELVWLDRIPDHGPAEFPCYDMYPQDGRGVPESGVLSSAKDADAAKGRIIYEAICDGLSAAVAEEFRS